MTTNWAIILPCILKHLKHLYEERTAQHNITSALQFTKVGYFIKAALNKFVKFRFSLQPKYVVFFSCFCGFFFILAQM